MAGAANTEVDFGAIEDNGGGRVRVPEGNYRVKFKSVTYGTSQAGNPMFTWVLVGTEGKLKGKELKEYTALTTKALWKLRDMMEATTGKAPGGKVNTRKLLDHCKKHMVGKEVGVTLEDDEYVDDKGKSHISSKVSDYLSLEDLSDDVPEDDAEIEDDEESEDEDDLLEGMDRSELKKYIKAEDLDVKVLKSMSDDDLRAAIREAMDDDEDEEEDEVIEDVDLDEL